jgi:MFS family permease
LQNISALVVGTLLDRFGPKFCGIVSGLLIIPGSLCLAFESALPFDALMLGFFLLAFGGTFNFVPAFHLSNSFPQFQGLILSLITGAFDASAAVFLLFRVLYQRSNGTFDLRRFFLVYLIVPIFILTTQSTIMPTRSYETRAELLASMEATADPLQDVHDSDDELESQADVWKVRRERAAERGHDAAEIASLLGTTQQQAEFEEKEDDKRIASGIWGVLHSMPAIKQIRTPWFILIILFTILQMIRFNFFISTIWTQYEYMLGSATRATEVIEFFDLALPIGGVATVPFIGFLLDGTSTVTALSVLVMLSTFIGVLGAVPTISAAYANVCLFVIFRPLYYSAMSDYAAKVFGFQTFGTVYGLIITLSGILSFTQSGLQAAVHNTYHRNPGPVNLALAACGLLIGLALIMYVDVKGREEQRNRFPGDDDERRSLLLSRRPSRQSLYGTDAAPGSLGRRLSRSGVTLAPVSETDGT